MTNAMTTKKVKSPCIETFSEIMRSLFMTPNT